MNDDAIVKEMIGFVEEKELELQKSRLGNDAQAKSTTIKSIISKLEECVENEN